MRSDQIGRGKGVKDNPKSKSCLWWTTKCNIWGFGLIDMFLEIKVWWKTTFSGRRPSVEDDFWWKMFLACCLVRFAAFFDNLLVILLANKIIAKTEDTHTAKAIKIFNHSL